jgi:hypothetical protein
MDCNGAPTGPNGDPGIVPAEPAKEGGAGKQGALIVEAPPVAPRIPFAVPVAMLSRAIHDAELHMVNGRPAVAYDELSWLFLLVRTLRSHYAKDVADALEARILALVQLIAQGLDVFGRNFNYVPLTSFDQLSQLVRDQIGYLEKVELESRRVADAAATQGNRIDALRKAAVELKKFIDVKNKEAESRSLLAGALQDDIRRIFFELEAVHRELMAAESSFKNAIRNQNKCATFGNVLKFAALVATVVATAGTAAAFAASAMTAAQGLQQMESQAAENMTWKTAKSDFETIGKIVRPAGKNGKEFAQNLDDLQARYKDLYPDRKPIPDVLDQAEDAMKLVSAKDDFDAAIKPYMNLPEAKKYQAIMHKYIALAETRNNKILEHDSIVVEIAQVNVRILIERETVLRLAETTAANFDARLEENTAFLETSLATLKWGVIRQLVAMEKSLEYMVGAGGGAAYSDVSVAALSVTAASLLQRFGLALEAFGQEAQFGTRFPVKIASLLSPTELNKFVEGKPITFALNEVEDKLFNNFYALQTGRIAVVDNNGKQIAGALSITIEHCGRSVVRQRDRRSQVFAHVPVTASYIQSEFNEISARGDLLAPPFQGQARYVGVSPYGPWRIRLDNADDAGRKALRNGFLMFDVAFRTLPIGA